MDKIKKSSGTLAKTESAILKINVSSDISDGIILKEVILSNKDKEKTTVNFKVGDCLLLNEFEIDGKDTYFLNVSSFVLNGEEIKAFASKDTVDFRMTYLEVDQ